LCRGNTPQVFLYMLLPDVTHRNLFAFAVDDGDTEDAFTQEDSFGMVPKSAVPEIREEGFRLIKPMDSQGDEAIFAAAWELVELGSPEHISEASDAYAKC